jgi:hypothetical protein
MTTLYKILSRTRHQNLPLEGGERAEYFQHFLHKEAIPGSWWQKSITVNFEALKKDLVTTYQEILKLEVTDYYAFHDEFKSLLEDYRLQCQSHGEDSAKLFQFLNSQVVIKNRHLLEQVKGEPKTLTDQNIQSIYHILLNKDLTNKQKRTEVETVFRKMLNTDYYEIDKLKALLRVLNNLLNDKVLAGNDYNLMLSFYNVWEIYRTKPDGSDAEAFAAFEKRKADEDFNALVSYAAMLTQNQKLKRYMDTLVIARQKRTKDSYITALWVSVLLAFVTVEPSMMFTEAVSAANRADDMSDSEKIELFTANIAIGFILALTIIGITVYFFKARFSKEAIEKRLKSETIKANPAASLGAEYTIFMGACVILAAVEAFAALLLVNSAITTFDDKSLMEMDAEVYGPVIGVAVLMALLCVASVFCQDALPVRELAERKTINNKSKTQLHDPIDIKEELTVKQELTF